MSRITPLRVLVHLGGLLPLAWLVYDALAGNLSVNPVQDVEQRTGRAAVLFVVLALAVSPLVTLTGWNEPTRRRRALGLYGFLYAALHVTTFTALDFGLDWPRLLHEIVSRRYTLAGAAAFLLLLPLAATSFQGAKRRLGPTWKRLQRLIYLAAPLAVLHFTLARKGNLSQLQGDILLPLAYALVVLALLVLRLAPVRQWLSAARHRPG